MKVEPPAPISEPEKALVLELLPVALNEFGIAAALGCPTMAMVARVRRALEALETEGRVVRISPWVWHLA